MHGIPGFEIGAESEDFAFERLTEDQALEISDIWFDQPAFGASRLDTERDDTFLLQTRHGERVLKVAHPADTIDAIEFQLGALRHAAKADHSLPLQRIVTTPGGALWLGLPDGRVARMFHWLPGELWRNSTTGPHELSAIGDALGRLSRALSTFTQPHGSRPSAWDLQTVPRLVTLLAQEPNDVVGEAITRYTERVTPLIQDLPTQTIHNDFNPGNVLVDPGNPEFVVGILDFGDVVHSFRVADLAIAISYAIFPFRKNWSDVAPLIAGFEAHVPLNSAERSALPSLVTARLAQRILINGWASAQEHETFEAGEAMVATLAALLNQEA